jgi:hypothetical protein
MNERDCAARLPLETEQLAQDLLRRKVDNLTEVYGNRQWLRASVARPIERPTFQPIEMPDS